jgi:hypothetical protein
MRFVYAGNPEQLRRAIAAYGRSLRPSRRFGNGRLQPSRSMADPMRASRCGRSAILVSIN